MTLITQSKVFELRDFAWSPDSKWVAYSAPESRSVGKIWVYSLDQKKSFPVTDGWYAAGNPAFSGDGKYLFFVSARDFNPTYGQTEFNFTYSNMERVYLVTLQKETHNPFEPNDDEVNSKPRRLVRHGPVSVKIDTDGLERSRHSTAGAGVKLRRSVIGGEHGLLFPFRRPVSL